MPKFKTKIVQARDMDATGIEVPARIVEAFGAGKKPKVSVTLNGYTYRSTIAVMGGKFMLPLAREHRTAADVAGGDTVKVTLELDTAPREVEIPKDFAAALKKAGLTQRFAALAYSHRKAHVQLIEQAKASETRQRRIAKAIAAIGGS